MHFYLVRANLVTGFAFLLLMLVPSCATLPKTMDTRDLCGNLKGFPNLVNNILVDRARESSAGYAIAVIKKKSGEIECEESVNADLVIYPASSIKTLIAVGALKKVDEGLGSLNDPLVIHQPNAALECAHWDCHFYGPGMIRTVEQLLNDMIIFSNNIATNELIDWVSKEEINKLADRMQASSLRTYRKVYDDFAAEPEIADRNEATARGMVQFYRELSSGRLQILSDRSRVFLNSLLEQQHSNNRLNADFPKSIKFRHKTGNTSDSSSDAGFFEYSSDFDIVLVGLQGFHDYETLRKIGVGALRLIY